MNEYSAAIDKIYKCIELRDYVSAQVYLSRLSRHYDKLGTELQEQYNEMTEYLEGVQEQIQILEDADFTDGC